MLFTALTHTALANEELDTVLDLFGKVEESHVSYIEKRKISFLKDELTSRGTLSYKKPNYIRKQVLLPKPEMFEARGEYLRVQQGEGKVREFLLQNYPLVETFINAYRGLLTGNRKLLQDNFEIFFEGNVQDWRIILKPRDEEAAMVIDYLSIEGKDGNPLSFITRESSGDTSSLVIPQKND